MSTVKKGILTKPLEWAKHLRPFGKKAFWSKERINVKKDIEKRKEETNNK
jgi:hypothetical protein